MEGIECGDGLRFRGASPASGAAQICRPKSWRLFACVGLALAAVLTSLQTAGAEKFTIATYNLENYLLEASGTRPAKSAQARSKAQESIRTIRPDIIGLQEVGGAAALAELRQRLAEDGVDYPHSDLVQGGDTNIQVAVLSRFPITARHPHSKDGFLLNGRRFQTARGIAELDIQVNSEYALTLFVVHLKSRRPAAEADESELREQEALIVRDKIDARLRAAPDLNLIVVGDLNDAKDSPTVHAVLGRGKLALVDLRPAERNGDHAPPAARRTSWRNIAWTHFYAKEDTYSRFDYILISRGMTREFDAAGSYVLALPDWGMASDHRPVVASFFASDR